MVGGKGTHPSPAHAQCGGIGHTLHVADIALLFVDGRAAAVRKRTFFIIRADIFGLGDKHHTDFNANANLHGILDAEAQLQRNLAVGRVDLIALEVFHVAVALVFEVVVRVRVQDACIGEIVVRRHAQSDGNGVFRAFAQGEIVGEGEAYALVEAARIPVVARGEL